MEERLTLADIVAAGGRQKAAGAAGLGNTLERVEDT